MIETRRLKKWEGDWPLGYNSMKIWELLNIA